jgi:peroxiredoxin
MRLPNIALSSTAGGEVDLGRLSGRTVVYCYPMTGIPGKALPPGWDLIPGARGCTPQNCSFRDHHQELRALGAQVFGLSTQPTDYQLEMAQRLHLTFPILSDADLRFATALGLPTFEAGGMKLIKRLTLVLQDSAIEHAFYPVFPPDQSAAEVVSWLTNVVGRT